MSNIYSNQMHTSQLPVKSVVQQGHTAVFDLVTNRAAMEIC